MLPTDLNLILLIEANSFLPSHKLSISDLFNFLGMNMRLSRHAILPYMDHIGEISS